MVTKSNLRSTVHRPVHIDTIGVKRFDTKGRVTGEILFAGLFTSVAYSLSPRAIPYLRRKVDAAMELSGYDPSSHSGKAFMHVLENYPRDELFQVGAGELHEISRGVVNLQERQRTALFVRHDPFDRFVSAFVYTPRDRYTQAIRRAFGEILSTAFNGRISAYYTHFSDEILGKRALDAVIDDLFAHQSALTQRVFESGSKSRASEKLIEGWIDGRGAAASRVRELVSDLRTADGLDLAMFAVANKELRNLVGA